MKTSYAPCTKQGLTLTEILVAIVVIAVLAGLLLPALNKPHHGRGRINCVSNLKQVGLAMRMFSNEHNDKFPWAVPMASGGSLEYSNSMEVFRHFMALSNVL